MNQKYLVWIDILGFERLPEEMALQTNCGSPIIRKTILGDLNILFDSHKEKGNIFNYFPHSGDAWILVLDTLEQSFNVINDVMNHPNPFHNQTNITFEIALDVASLDESDLHDKDTFISSDEAIRFLKSNLANLHNAWYKQTNQESNKSTFIVCGDKLYHELNPFDQDIFEDIEYSNSKQVTILHKADNEKFRTRSKYLAFLNLLELNPGGIHDRINDLFVPPLEYVDFESFLQNEKVVFITGTPEYGKTYTSLHLLWKYFLQGYFPVWVRGIETRDREDSRGKLRDIQSILKENHIFYFEDPFGITSYEGENLERDVRRLLDHIDNFDNTYVIFTSREEIIKQLKQSELASRFLSKHERNLKIKTPSYDFEHRKAILFNWAKYEKCMWFEDQKLTSFVLKSLSKAYLSTPLAIRDFCVATTQKKNQSELTNALINKSSETGMVFAQEIINMPEDKILFLLILLLNRFMPTSVVKEIYYDVGKNMKLVTKSSFEQNIDWFKNDKITVSGVALERVVLSHPSYYDSLDELLRKNNPNVQHLFVKIIVNMLDSGHMRRVTRIGLSRINPQLLLNFSYNDTKELIQAFMSQEKLYFPYALVLILGNWNKVGKTLKDYVYKVIISNEVIDSTGIINTINPIYDQIPEDIRNWILAQISIKDNDSFDFAILLLSHYNDISDDLQTNLFQLIKEEDEVAKPLASVLINSLKSNPTFFDNDVALTLINKTGFLNPIMTISNDLFVELIEIPRISSELVKLLENHFTEYPQNIRNYLLHKLAKDEVDIQDILFVITSHFDDLSETVQQIIWTKAENIRTAKFVAQAIIANFNMLPNEVQSLLFELGEKHEPVKLLINKFEYYN